MNKIRDYLKIKNLWVLLFAVCFISVPLALMPKGSVLAIALFAAVLFFVNKFKIGHFSVFLFLLALVLRIGVVIAVPTPPVSDFEVLLGASQQMIAGKGDYINTSYFQAWPYQIGFAFFQSLLLRIWNDVLFLKILNSVLAAATCVLVYKIACEFASDKASQCAALIYCFLPFPFFYVTVLSNQFVSSFLIYLGLYILISEKIKINEQIKYLIFGVLLAIANLLRPESIIPLFATVLYLVISLKKDNLKRNLLNILILLVVYYGTFKLFECLFVVTGVSPLGLGNNDPLWKFVAGFNHSTHGQYSGNDWELLKTTSAMDLIKSRVFVPISELISLFIEKMKIFWCGGGVSWAFTAFYKEGLPFLGATLRIVDDVALAELASKWLMVISYFLLAVGAIKCFKNRCLNSKVLLIINQVFVTFGVYLLIEVQPRYIYHVQVSTLIIAAIGIGVIIDGAKKILDKNKKTDNSKTESE